MNIKQRADSSRDQNSGSGWLTTFNDMITLLMVFFVLLFTMGSLDVKRVKHFQNALQSAMGVLNQGVRVDLGVVQEQEWSDKDINRIAELNLETRQKKLEQYYRLLKEKLGNKAKMTKSGIKIVLEDKLIFPAASAGITPAGKKLLKRISRMLKQTNLYVRVEGHTDNLPIATRRYPSNWELSTARAVNVVKYLIESGVSPTRLSAAGYGDSKPVASNTQASGRAKNRRVEIIMSPGL